MQRVLSFQMARGLSESSEFVTKRMCFSLIFSVGFLSLLCGFLLGRFATQRAIEFRAVKKRLELAGNGLENTEYLQHLVLEQLERASLDPDFETNWESLNFMENDIRQVNEILSNLSFIQKVVEHPSHLVATTRGSREPDRYVVLAAGGEGVGVTLKLAKILNQVSEEYRWKPRRSLVFCFFSGSSNLCSQVLSSIIRHRVVAYIVIQQEAFQGKGSFTVSGSHIIQSIILDSVTVVKNWFPHNNQLLFSNSIYNNTTTSQLALDIPHVVLSFLKDNVTYNENHHEKDLRKIILAQILGESVWRLSECLVIKWNPSYFNETISKALESINNTELREIKEKMYATLFKLTNGVNNLNGRINTIENIKTLDTRILNDLLMDLDRVLLCLDNQQEFKTDWREFFTINHRSPNKILMYINGMVKCYENAIHLLED